MREEKESETVPVASEPAQPAYLSARAVRTPGLSAEEREAAEAEAQEWARRVNRC